MGVHSTKTPDKFDGYLKSTGGYIFKYIEN